VESHDLPDPDSTGRECPGNRVNLGKEAAIGRLRAARPVDERDPLALGWADRCEEIVVDAQVGNLDIGIRAEKKP